jgi:hypothetical protein
MKTTIIVLLVIFRPISVLKEISFLCYWLTTGSRKNFFLSLLPERVARKAFYIRKTY